MARKSIRDARQSQRPTTDYPKTHFLLGYGKVEEAIASFERSVALSPDTPEYRDALEAAAKRMTGKTANQGSVASEARVR